MRYTKPHRRDRVLELLLPQVSGLAGGYTAEMIAADTGYSISTVHAALLELWAKGHAARCVARGLDRLLFGNQYVWFRR